MSSIRNHIEKKIPEWKNRLWLNQWKINTVYCFNEQPTDREGTFVAAETISDWKYFKASVKFFLPAFVGEDKEFIDEVICHEFLHILLNEMRENEIKHEERIVSHLTAVVLSLKR